MNNDLPEDINDGINYLEAAETYMDKAYESIEDDRDIIVNFKRGIDYLSDFIEHNPGSLHKTYIENIISSYLRKFILKLSSLDIMDEDWWIFYCFILLEVKDHIKDILPDHPDVANALSTFFKNEPTDVPRFTIDSFLGS